MLPAAAAERLGLVQSDDSGRACVVVISHDCDIANDNLAIEPCVEVIIGRLVAKCEGNFAWGKAPRTLHYTASRDTDSVTIEVTCAGKRSVQKSDLAAFEPDGSFQIDGRTLATLRSWLGSRYNRAAFPDAFVRRIDSSGVASKLTKLLGPVGDLVSFVYFDVDEGASIERSDGDPYQLGVVLVFPAGQDPEESTDAAEELAGKVSEAFAAKLKGGRDIAFRDCIAICEDDLPVSKAKVLTQWRLEHMTLRSDRDQPGPPEL